jgi:multiple sugar transport system substrate-binding protein
MKQSLRRLMVMLIAISVLISACTPSPTTPDSPIIGPTDPPPAETTTITWATLAGFYTDWAAEVAKDFEEQYNVNVEIIKIEYPTLYEKEVLDMVGGTGVYDIVTWNVSWKAEWAHNGYLLPLDDYIAKEDPSELQLEDISPSLLRTGGYWNENLYGIVYYTFTPGMFYRCDLFEHPLEKAAFEEKFGYPLDIPTTYDQFVDIASFFRRVPGDTLKGETIDYDFYGIGLSAGRFTQMNDELFTLVWTFGGDILNDDGSPAVTDEEYITALDYYVNKLLPSAPPGAISNTYDWVVAQFASGLIAMTGPFYLDQWPSAIQVENEVPGAELCAAGLPAGGKTWAGPFTLGISKASKNPDLAWKFLMWITGPEAQRKFALGGGSTARLSILQDPTVYTQSRDMTGHFPILADVLEHAERCWYTNLLWTPTVAKIYEEMPAWNSAATSGQMTIQQAMEGLEKKIVEFCNGNCEIFNEGVPREDPNCEYSFDKSLQMRKP